LPCNGPVSACTAAETDCTCHYLIQ
jgi:hypothetical protein